MKLFRRDIFETNSSSTNCLILDTKATLIIPDTIRIVEIGGSRDFEFSDTDSKFSILAYHCESLSEFLYLCYKVYGFGVKNIILFNPETHSEISPNYSDWFWCDMGDSADELRSFIEDDESLKYWLFSNDSSIEGHDNEYDY